MLTSPEESGASMLPARIHHFAKLLPYNVFGEYVQTHIQEIKTAVGVLRNYVECLIDRFCEAGDIGIYFSSGKPLKWIVWHRSEPCCEEMTSKHSAQPKSYESF